MNELGGVNRVFFHKKKITKYRMQHSALVVVTPVNRYRLLYKVSLSLLINPLGLLPVAGI